MAQTVSSPKRNFRGACESGSRAEAPDVLPRSFAIRGELKAFEMLSSTDAAHYLLALRR